MTGIVKVFTNIALLPGLPHTVSGTTGRSPYSMDQRKRNHLVWGQRGSLFT